MQFLLSSLCLFTFATAVIGCGVDRAPQFAPVPDQAKGLPIGPEGYGIESYGKGAYMVTEGNYQGTILWYDACSALTTFQRYSSSPIRG